jgi:SAM-dependent methyltransferase
VTEARHAPATERNREPILAVLLKVLPPSPRVLEVAAGTGQHAAYFAASITGLRWFPTDADPDALPSIEAWRAPVAESVAAPMLLDVARDPWPDLQVDAVFCANMIHIAPWEAALGLLRGAARGLPSGGPLVLYGPFRRGGAHTAPSNEAFDASLRARDPAWGVRDLEAVLHEAGARGLALDRVVEMPANNLTIVLRRA